MASKGNEALRRRSTPLQNAVWCGVVCSLSAVFTALNFCPMQVHYRIDAQVLAGPEPAAGLKRLQETSAATDSAMESDPAAPRLVDLKILDEKTLDRPYPGIADGEPLALLAVQSMWATRTTTTKVRTWLEQLSNEHDRSAARTSGSSDERFSRWHAEASAHYLKQVDKARDQLIAGAQAASTSSDETSPVDGSSTAPSGIPARLASHDSDRPIGTTLVSAIKPSLSDSAAAELQELEKIRESLTSTLNQASQSGKEVSPANGGREPGAVLAVSGSPRVHPVPAPISSETFASIFILAISVGAIGGWSCYRAESGGIHLPSEVSRDLELEGLPLLSVVTLTGPDVPGDWIERTAAGADTIRRVAIRKLTMICEFTLMFWCTALVVRSVLDPLWRTMLFDNPLAALSRMIIGMP